MSNLAPSFAAVSLSGPDPALTSDRRPLNAQPYDSILDASGARKIIFDQGEVYCRVAHYSDNSGNWEFTCDGKKRNNRGLRQHLFEPRGPHRRFGEVIGILRPEQRNFHGPLTACIFYPPSGPRQPPPQQQHQQQYAQLAHRPAQNQGLYHAHPGWQPFEQQQQQQQQQQLQSPYAPASNQGFYEGHLAGQKPSQQQQQQNFTQHAQLTHRLAPNQGFNHDPFSNQPPAQQQQQHQNQNQNQLAYCLAPNQSTYHIHHADQVSVQQHRHSQLSYRSAQNQGFYHGQHSCQPPAQQQQFQHSEITCRPAPSRSYYHGHLSGQLQAQQQQQQQQQQEQQQKQQQQHHVQRHAQSAANQPNLVPYPAPLISQDLYDLAWAAKLRSEQQQFLTIQSGGRSHDLKIVADGPPPPASERWNPFPQQTVVGALDVDSDAAEAAIATRRNRDGPAQESVWIDAPEGARILKCFWQRGELYVQPEDGYMFCGYGLWRRCEEDVPVSMEVGTVICGCFQRDGELWVQDGPEGKYNRYGFKDEM